MSQKTYDRLLRISLWIAPPLLLIGIVQAFV